MMQQKELYVFLVIVLETILQNIYQNNGVFKMDF